MKELILIIVGAALVNNVVLSQFLGLCAFVGVSNNVKNAVGMGLAVAFVLTISSFVAAIVYNVVLIPNQLEYLKTIVFILVIAAMVQLVEMIIKKYSPALYSAMGVYLALITTNCAVLGVALINVQKEYGVLKSTINGFSTAVGYLIAIVILAGIREKTVHSPIPKPFQGLPITLIIACLMSMAFFGFAGLI